MPTLILLLLFAVADGELDSRPWLVRMGLDRQARERLDAAGDDARAILEHARWCRDAGLFRETGEALANLLADPVVGAEARALLGLKAGAGDEKTPVFEEIERYVDRSPPIDVAPARLDEKARDQLLQGRHREVKLANKSTYFDLWTDLAPEELAPYTAVLNAYYRTLKGRFRAYDPSSIDVVLFKSRAEYLIDYARSFGKSGEHVLGYYVPGRKLLVFYDEPDGMDDVVLTAKHECTHLLVDLSYRGARIPPWLNEGLACFLAGDGLEMRGRYTSDLLLTVAEGLEKNRGYGIEELMAVEPAGLKYEHYAWSWSLLMFLNEKRHDRKFQQFLLDLREELNGEIEPEQVPVRIGAVFRDVFGDNLEGLEREWLRWLASELSLERPDQLIDLGYNALKRAERLEKSDEISRWVEVAQRSFTAAGEQADSALEGSRRLGLLNCWVQRAHAGDPDLREFRLLLRGLHQELAGLEGVGQEADRALLVRGALALLQEVAGVRRPGREPYDLRAALRTRAGGFSDERRLALQALVVLADQLVEQTFRALAVALERDPTDRRVANQWLFLSLDVEPSRLESIFETLRLLAELDPDDRNQAALGTAYHALGRVGWGRRLLEEANRQSARPASLAAYRWYADLK